jgi:hypothetical protein
MQEDEMKHVTRMKEVRDAHKNLVRNPESVRQMSWGGGGEKKFNGVF